VLRRSARGDTGEPKPRLTAGAVEVDPIARRAYRDGVPLVLTAREFDLLAYLLAHPGVAYSREQLMRAVWGWTFGDQSTVTVHVRRLREKVEDDPTRPTLIATVWGVGYRLDVP
jgi:two-component system response regulator ResD